VHFFGGVVPLLFALFTMKSMSPWSIVCLLWSRVTIDAFVVESSARISNDIRSVHHRLPAEHAGDDDRRLRLTRREQDEQDAMLGTDYKEQTIPSRRRQILQRIVAGAITTSLIPQSHYYSAIAHAACLYGDTSIDCIGVYKMPMDDEARKYTTDPEILKRFAPDLRWVPPVQYPKTYKEARTELALLQMKCLTLEETTIKGNLTDVGVQVLEIIPRVTVCGQVLIRALSSEEEGSSSMKGYRAEVAHSELLGRLGQCDVLIGQALKGQMGAMAPAQIQILSEIREANSFYDDLMRAIPETVNDKSSQKKR
jgi:hypothetical protein